MAARRAGTPAWWLKPTNRLLMALKRRGVGLRELPVLTVRGRRSGEPRSTPVTVLDFEGGRYLLCGYPGAQWPRNARADGGRASLDVNGVDEPIRLIELDEPDALRVLRVWPVDIPQGAKIMRDAGVVDDVTPEAFEKIVGVCPVFRIEHDDGAG